MSFFLFLFFWLWVLCHFTGFARLGWGVGWLRLVGSLKSENMGRELILSHVRFSHGILCVKSENMGRELMLSHVRLWHGIVCVMRWCGRLLTCRDTYRTLLSHVGLYMWQKRPICDHDVVHCSHVGTHSLPHHRMTHILACEILTCHTVYVLRWVGSNTKEPYIRGALLSHIGLFCHIWGSFVTYRALLSHIGIFCHI